MGIYKCFRCGYTASQKSNLISHLNRKNICKPLLADSIENIKKHYGFEILQTTGKNSRLSTGKQQVATGYDNRQMNRQTASKTMQNQQANSRLACKKII